MLKTLGISQLRLHVIVNVLVIASIKEKKNNVKSCWWINLKKKNINKNILKLKKKMIEPFFPLAL